MTLFATKDSSYQAGMGIEQGADYAFFGGQKIFHQDMMNFIRSLHTVTDQPLSGSVLENSLFSPVYGTHYVSAVTDQSKMSMYLPLPSVGHRLVIDCQQCVDDANLIVYASQVTGVTLVRPSGSSLSSLSLSAAGWALLICNTAGQWQVAQAHASVTEQPSS